MVAYFIQHVHFEGCNGLEVTDQVRVTIAAQACLLALNLPRGSLGRLKEILVYPTAFVPKLVSWSPTAPESAPHAALGESWHRGTVILAWDDVLHGVEIPTDGHNVALHEFAHQLDAAGGEANGIPQLGSTQRFAAWTRVLEDSFARFSRETAGGRESVMDAYGATNPTEFFAVATETFFERPAELRHQYPDLYQQLKQYYRQ
jgi:Mlc titration factor MtfA (ptsG expression regulator)